MYTINHGALAAFVSPAERSTFLQLDRITALEHLHAHQQVIENVQRDFAVLPVKFGTVLAGESQVERLLEQHAGRFGTALERLGARQQVEVVVLWDPMLVFQQLAATPEIAMLKAHAAQPHEDTIAARAGLGQVVKAAFDRRRLALSEQLLAPLRALTPRVISNSLMDDRMVLNVALLLDAAERDALDHCLDALDERFSGEDGGVPLHFRCVGPLPPYSFASVEIQLPDASQIDAARQLLDLPLATTAAAIRQSYRALAGRLHPDHNPHDPDAAIRMAALAEAAQLLGMYTQHSSSEAIDLCWDAVANTLLVDLVVAECL